MSYKKSTLGELRSRLPRRLNSEEKEIFNRYVETYAELMASSELDAFIVGFRLGARFAGDTFMSDEAPFRAVKY